MEISLFHQMFFLIASLHHVSEQTEPTEFAWDVVRQHSWCPSCSPFLLFPFSLQYYPFSLSPTRFFLIDIVHKRKTRL